MRIHSLRFRLALSHTLPILLFVPLLGLMLLSQLERRYFLNNLAGELTTQGALLAAFTRDDEATWHDPTAARRVLDQLQQQITGGIELVDPHGILLATNTTDSATQPGQPDRATILQGALQGSVSWTIDRSVRSAVNVIDVAVPVIDQTGRVEGVVRLFQRLGDIQGRLGALRWLILLILCVGSVVALSLGLLLARSIGNPLLQISDAVARFSPEQVPIPLIPVGPLELQQLAATLNGMQSHLYALERSRKLLLAGIVHEVARPLGAMKAAAQTIVATGDRLLSQDLARGIDEQIDQLRLQLDDLALLGELELQGVRLTCAPTDLTEVVFAQCAWIAPFAHRRQISLESSGVLPLPIVLADATRIGQIIGNLLHNACKYSAPGGQIIVLTATEERGNCLWATVRICDDGPGIDALQQERIFEFFYRSPEQRRIHQGMGIGLALARQLAEAHGGQLTVTSVPGNGATFCLQLPLPMASSLR